MIETLLSKVIIIYRCQFFRKVSNILPNTVKSKIKIFPEKLVFKAWFPYNRKGTCGTGCSAWDTTWDMSQADFFNGNTCPRYRRQSACGTGRVELSSTFQAVLVPQADENFNGNTHPRYRRQAIDMLITT